MKNNIHEIITKRSQELFEKVKGYREHLHKYPELSYQEFNTMQFVSDTLTQLGIEHKTSVGDTGVVAVIYGNKNTPNQPCIGLRADLDALPIREENQVEYKSTVDGVMHACGHDVHTSILLGVAPCPPFP